MSDQSQFQQLFSNPTIATPNLGRILTVGYNGNSFAAQWAGRPSTGPTFPGWEVANKAVFVPIHIFQAVTFSTLFFVNNGSTSGNRDLGIYALDGTKIVTSGSLADSGTNTLQKVSVTTTALSPGTYYIAMARVNTTGGCGVQPVGNSLMTMIGVKEQASAFPLPSPATPVATSLINYPILGIIPVGVW